MRVYLIVQSRTVVCVGSSSWNCPRLQLLSLSILKFQKCLKSVLIDCNLNDSEQTGGDWLLTDALPMSCPSVGVLQMKDW